MRILGLDPGINGGLAVFHDGVLSETLAMPTVDMPTSKAGKSKVRRVSPHLLALALRKMLPLDAAYVEVVGPMARQGLGSTFTFGHGYGLAEGVVVGLEIPMSGLYPQEWRRLARVPGTMDKKVGSQHRALQLFPGFADVFSIKAREGHWEASLIAYAGMLRDRRDVANAV